MVAFFCYDSDTMKTVTPYFIRKGIFFIPTSTIGWIVFFACVVYGVYAFVDIDSTSHSVSDTLINWVFTMAMLTIGYTIFAYLMNEKDKGQEKSTR